MARYYQIAFFLLAAGHVYCLKENEFLLKDGKKFELLSTEKHVKDLYLNGTHINKLVNYHVSGIARYSSYEKNIAWSLDLLVATELQLTNGHRYTGNCNVYLDPPYGEVSQNIFDVLEKHIREDLCNNTQVLDRSIIDQYEDKNRKLKEMMLSELKYLQAISGFNTAFDIGLLLAQKTLGIQDFIDIDSMQLSYLDIFDVTFGNLSTVKRADTVKISHKDDVLALTVLLKMNPVLTFNTKIALPLAGMFAPKIKVHSKEILVGFTIKLDYTKEECEIKVEDVKLDFGHGLKIQMLSTILDYMMMFVTGTVQAALQPNLLISQLQSVLHNVLSKHLDCEAFKPMIKQL